MHVYCYQVITIQACQIRNPLSALQNHNNRADPAITEPYIESTDEKNRQKNHYVVLQRPNTVLMLSTVFGGTAIRGAFTDALSEELLEADGCRNITTMFNRAVDRMKKNKPECADQTPELCMTTQKDLILPPARETCQEEYRWDDEGIR